MKKLIHFLQARLSLLGMSSRENKKKSLSFFDFSSREKVKILRAAGREAQRKQHRFLEAYNSQMGTA